MCDVRFSHNTLPWLTCVSLGRHDGEIVDVQICPLIGNFQSCYLSRIARSKRIDRRNDMRLLTKGWLLLIVAQIAFGQEATAQQPKPGPEVQKLA